MKRTAITASLTLTAALLLSLTDLTGTPGAARADAARAATTPDATESVASDEERLFTMLALAPEMAVGEGRRLIEASDDARTRLAEASAADESEPTQPVDLGSRIRERLEGVEISSEEVQRYYLEHLELFGERSLAESRLTIERLIAIERVAEEHGFPLATEAG